CGQRQRGDGGREGEAANGVARGGSLDVLGVHEKSPDSVLSALWGAGSMLRHGGREEAGGGEGVDAAAQQAAQAHLLNERSFCARPGGPVKPVAGSRGRGHGQPRRMIFIESTLNRSDLLTNPRQTARCRAAGTAATSHAPAVNERPAHLRTNLETR